LRNAAMRSCSNGVGRRPVNGATVRARVASAP
jgi:hypothetical protein